MADLLRGTFLNWSNRR